MKLNYKPLDGAAPPLKAVLAEDTRVQQETAALRLARVQVLLIQERMRALQPAGLRGADGVVKEVLGVPTLALCG